MMVTMAHPTPSRTVTSSVYRMRDVGVVTLSSFSSPRCRVPVTSCSKMALNSSTRDSHSTQSLLNASVSPGMTVPTANPTACVQVNMPMSRSCGDCCSARTSILPILARVNATAHTPARAPCVYTAKHTSYTAESAVCAHKPTPGVMKAKGGKKRTRRDDKEDADVSPPTSNGHAHEEDGPRAAAPQLPPSMSKYIRQIPHAAQFGGQPARPLIALGKLMSSRGFESTALVPNMSSMGMGLEGTDTVFKPPPAPSTHRGGVEGVLTAIMKAVTSTPVPGGLNVRAVRHRSVKMMTFEETAACLSTPIPRFSIGDMEVVPPACASGSDCVAKESRIPGMSSLADAELMVYMTKEEFAAFRRAGTLPEGARQRRCILCMRSIQADILLSLESSNALKQPSMIASASRIVACPIVNPVRPGQYKASACFSPNTYAALHGDYTVALVDNDLFVSRESPLRAPWNNCLNWDTLVWIREDKLRDPLDGRASDTLPPAAAIAEPHAEAQKAGSAAAAWAPLQQYSSVVGARHGSEASPDADPLAVVTAGVPSTATPAGHPSSTRVTRQPTPPFGAAVARSAPSYAGGGPPPAVVRGKTVGRLAKSIGMVVPPDSNGVKHTTSFAFPKGKVDPPSSIPGWVGVTSDRIAEEEGEDDGDDDFFPDGDGYEDEEGLTSAPTKRRPVRAGKGDACRQMGTVSPLPVGAVLGLAAAAGPADF